jgi:hypothetical protein
MVNGLFKIRKWSKVHNNDLIVLIVLVKDEQTICVPNQFVIGLVVLKLLIKRLAVAMMNKTVGNLVS